MANPSLQIGNDNWAIKEDNLLGYSTAGSRFVPQPITMTRATLGTRVNPSGLVEDVALLGSDLVTNGDFSNGTTGWNFTDSIGAVGTYFGRDEVCEVNFTNSSTIYAWQSSILTSDKIYKVTLDYYIPSTNTSVDNMVIKLGSTSSTSLSPELDILDTWTSVTLYGTADAGEFNIYRGSGTIGDKIYLDNVSVKEATIDNLPRVDYTDGTSSLLVEPQRTNLIPYSEDFSVWTGLIALSIGLNQGVSPNGLTEANLLSVGIDVSATRHRLYGLYSFVSGDTYTYSLFAKKDEQDWFQLMFSSTAFDAQSYANFDLNNGVVGNTGTSTTANIIDYGSGWYRCSITCTATASVNATYEVLTTNNTDSGRYLKYQSTTAVNVCYLWGAQLEESYATSYIPTSGSTVTRNQEEYKKSGISDKINSEEGVLFAEIAALADDSVIEGISLSDGTTSNRVVIFKWNASNTIRGRVTSEGTNTLNQSETLSDITSFNKIAIKYKLNDFAIWINGVEVFTDNSGAVPTGLNQLYLSSTGGGLGSDFYGKVKQLQIFKTALTDEQLTALTT